jgi:hypothetical protein
MERASSPNLQKHMATMSFTCIQLPQSIYRWQHFKQHKAKYTAHTFSHRVYTIILLKIPSMQFIYEVGLDKSLKFNQNC